jgi:formylglycine-generating enzyme required for sulfatase activity
VLLGRGERLRLNVELPEAAKVPEGFVYIPEGRFLFGSAADEGVRRGFFSTVPLHEVKTSAYLIARNETTFAEYLAFLESLPAAQAARHRPRVASVGFTGALALDRPADGRWRLTLQPAARGYSARAGEPLRYEGRPRRAVQDWMHLPVSGISWDDAEAYLAWLDRTGRVPGARLCTESEWERAARGADEREFPHGARLDPDDANFDETYGKRPLAFGPDEVGSHPASRSPFGVDDLAGNVWEWTRSSLADGERTARGGSYYFAEKVCRSVNRQVPEPGLRDSTLGLRVCAAAGGR